MFNTVPARSTPHALFAVFVCLTTAFVSQGAPAPPQSIAEFGEKPVLVQVPDSTLLAFFVHSADDKQIVTSRVSADLGSTWGDEEPVLELSLEPGGWALPEALVDKDGEVHLFFLNDAHTGVIRTGEEQRPRAGQSHERRLDIWHARSREGRTHWEPPKRIWEGYTGALNSVIQTQSGRILLPFSCRTDRTWSNRGEGLDAFTFRGQYDSTLVFSDDGGDSWTWPPVRLKVPVPDIVSAYGSVEPVIVELRDGRIWMLIRTQQGRFYESFSINGNEWTAPRPSAITSSDSPGGIVRTSDGRLVLFWNNCQRYPYAYGGRHVLHAAVSDDDGRTWRGYREVARDRLRNEPPPPRGDHGTAYPFPIALRDGRVMFATGQGEGRVACKVLDPEWLTETRQEDRFADGLETWSVFGTKGVELVQHPDKPEAHGLSIRKTDADWPACAVWNFPALSTGAIRVRIRPFPGFRGAYIGITDHFSNPFDQEDVFHNLYQFDLGPEAARAGHWQTLELRWDCSSKVCTVALDGKQLAELRQTRDSVTPCYLRLRSNSDDIEDGGFLIESVIAESAKVE